MQIMFIYHHKGCPIDTSKVLRKSSPVGQAERDGAEMPLTHHQIKKNQDIE